VTIVFLLIGVMVGPLCLAQEVSRGSEAILTNPGARSIGLGGAFAAIADDATAAFANPAGLVQIVRPEVSAEIRGTAARDGASSPYDLADSLSGLGFFSFVYPSSHWAVSLYSHRFASVGFNLFDPVNPVREFSVRSYAAAAAWEVSEHVSIGAGFGYFDGDRSPTVSEIGVSDSDWAANAGILWRPKQAWRFAAFYRQGPEFETTAASAIGGSWHDPWSGVKALEETVQLTFPDEYGFGAAWQPKAGAFTLSFEWDRVGSSIEPLAEGQWTEASGSEYHLGAEYAVLRWKPVVAFRAGFWREPGGTRAVIGYPEWEITTDRSWNHVALGIGLAFKRFQIDAGVDFWSRAVVGSLSLVYSF